MTELIIRLALDGLVALLLFVTILYCWKLNTRIRILQDSKSELAQLIKQFDESTNKATSSIAEIHQASRRIADNIQHKLDKANFLADDLQFMIEKGSKVADRMEGNLTGNRPAAASPSRAAAQPASRRDSRAEGEEMAAEPRRPRPERAAPAADQLAGQATQAAKGSLEAVLQKMTNRGDAQQAGGDKKPTARLRTPSEQELMDALKTGNRS